MQFRAAPDQTSKGWPFAAVHNRVINHARMDQSHDTQAAARKAASFWR